jgi:phosphoribosylamine-glycine ligase
VKFLFRTPDGMCLPIALRCQAEGNQVKYSVADSTYEDSGNGLVEKVINFEAAVQWSDVVIYDANPVKDEGEADKVKLMRPMLGAGKFAALLEYDRLEAAKLAQEVGIKIPDTQKFVGHNAWKKANEYLTTKGPSTDWVWKSNSDEKPAGARSFVSKDGRKGMQRMLQYLEERYKSSKGKYIPDFIMTTKVEGQEISTEAWFNGTSFELPNHTLERNKAHNGDIGEKIGCAGNVVWAMSKEAPLYRKLIEPLASKLAGKFVGPIDINAIIEKESNEPVFLEFSPRFGYDAVYALMELFQTDFSEFLYCVAAGQPWTGKLFEGFAGDVRLTIPPYPHDDDKGEGAGVPIFGADKKYNPHQHLVQVMLDHNDELVSEGGFVMALSAKGDSPKSSEEAAYKEVKKIRIPNMRYRTDLADVIQEVYDKIESTGWLNQGNQSGTLGLNSSWKRPTKMSWNHQARRF